jgi:hypothetical protein
MNSESVTVWAVVGRANRRKTSTIRALSGVGKLQRNWAMQHAAYGEIEAYIEPCGLQEKNISPQDFIDAVNEAGVHYAIVALRYERVGERPHDAADYLNGFRTVGWNIAGYAILGPGQMLPGFAGATLIPNAAQAPSNEIAAQLRGAWGME